MTTDEGEMFSFRTTSSEYTFSGLEPYRVYYFALAAETQAGLGPFSSDTPFRTGEAGEVQTHPNTEYLSNDHWCSVSGPTAAPDGVTIGNIGPNHAELSWSEPHSDDHNGIIRFYTVTIVEEETSTNFSLVSTSTSILLTDLHPFYSYNVSVAAVTTSPGPVSPTLTFRTLQAGNIIFSYFYRL